MVDVSSHSSREEYGNTVVDEYFHKSPCILYTPINIPGPGIDIEEFESQLVFNCCCENGQCDMNDCMCVAKYGRNYSVESTLLVTKFAGPVVECNSTCSCSPAQCKNRLVQFGPCQNLEIYETEDGKGMALRTKVPLPYGTFICEYAGEVISKTEAEKRARALGLNDMNYIFVLKEHLADGSTVNTYVDPSYIGNVGRYINHSCNPNCEIVPVRVDSPTPKISIFASRDLKAGEEITFHYGHTNGESDCATAKKICLCGETNCSKYLPFDETALTVKEISFL